MICAFKTRKYGYIIPDHGDYVIDHVTSAFEDPDEWELEMIAQDCAKNYHDWHDGWEGSWPMDFRIVNKSGAALGTYSVDRETRPYFVTRGIKT